jgi:hypothetical protein
MGASIAKESLTAHRVRSPSVSLLPLLEPLDEPHPDPPVESISDPTGRTHRSHRSWVE